MNKFGVIFLATVAILGARLAECGQQPFTITISPSQDGIWPGTSVYKAGSPVFVFVAMANNSGRKVSIPSIDTDLYTMKVRDENGNQVPEPEEREALAAPGSRKLVSGVVGELKPHKTGKDMIEIGAHWDLTRPGKYTIQVERQLPEELGNGSVKSNTITITVTD